MKQSRITEQPRLEGELTSAEQPELVRLRREFNRVKQERDFLKKGSGLLCQGKLRPYELIHGKKVNFPVTLMCRMLNVARLLAYGPISHESGP